MKTKIKAPYELQATVKSSGATSIFQLASNP